MFLGSRWVQHLFIEFSEQGAFLEKCWRYRRHKINDRKEKTNEFLKKNQKQMGASNNQAKSSTSSNNRVTVAERLAANSDRKKKIKHSESYLL